MDQPIDRAVLRDRIRAVAPAQSVRAGPSMPSGRSAARIPSQSPPQSNGGAYRDADLRRAAPMTETAPPSPGPAAAEDLQPDRGLEGLTAGPDEAFEDLDDRPLPPANGAAASSGDRPAGPGDADAPGGGEAAGGGEATDAPAQPAAPGRDESAVPPAALDPPLMRRIIYLATARPGEQPPYSRAQPNLDGEGLRYGIGRFSQASGDLGALLAMMAAEDEPRFREVFGDTSDDMLPEPDVDGLLRGTSAPVPAGSADFSARLADVGGRPLWDPAWIRKFKAAAEIEGFRTVQYRFTAERTLIPILPFARDLGLATERGLTMLTERTILLGLAPAREFVIAAAGPINTDALRSAALAHVAADPANATLAAFQAARAIPEAAGQFGPLSHAALVAALRETGNPPLQLPSPGLMLDQLVQAASQSGMPGLLAEIRANPNLGDQPVADANPVME